MSEVTDALGHKVTLEYDPGTGNLLSKTDFNGNTFENGYDGAGRLTGVRNADGELVKSINYHDELHDDESEWAGCANMQYVETFTYSNSDTADTWTKSYYDGLGRVYKTVSYAGKLDSNDIHQQTDITFDAAGRVETRTLPYINNGRQNPLFIHYSYDDAGRVVSEKRPVNENSADDVTVTTGYGTSANGLVVTKTDPKGNVSYAVYDARGRIIKKNEPLGAQLTYAYDGAGRLTRTVDAGNHETEIVYDSFGRKTSISDPNAGNVSYTYDIVGNMLSKTDASGKTIQYTYDAVNRLTGTDYPDDTPDVTYNYDETDSANGTGRLTSAERGNILTRYAYDQNGQMEYMRQRIKNIDFMQQVVENIDFIFTMEYDRQNRPAALTYPDGTRIDRVYSETGYLKAVKQGNGDGAYIQYALKLDGTGEFKNSIKRITGNGVETVIGFNPATMKAEAIESRNKNNTLLEQSDYIYDKKTGNITNINDTFDTTKSQTFEYDALNRLTKANGVYGEENYTYDPAGNLLKNAHGNLAYTDSSHPYAVTLDGEGNSYTYDANGNMLTGRGREMAYDAEGRMTTLKKDSVEIQKNTYDHAGHRVLQERKDGTLVFNINGLYELVKSPSRPDYHTRYIYGMEGDLASQVTTEGTALVAANFGHSYIFDKGYGGNPVISMLARGYIQADKYFSRAHNILKLQYVLVLILLALFTGAFIRSEFVTLSLSKGVPGITLRINRQKNRRSAVYARPAWSTATSFVLVISMIGSFSLTGCDEIITGITGGGGSTAVTPDTAGLPTLGTYYFHPDHLGSISYLTDHEGNVVTRMYYTPYGEKVKSASTGPDIFHQKYTGQIDDGEESELLYYNARYYDPKLGRFTSPDTIVPDPTYSQAFNRYMYVLGNPINYNDPSGHGSEEGGSSIGDGLGAAGGAGIGAGESAGAMGAEGGGDTGIDCHTTVIGGRNWGFTTCGNPNISGIGKLSDAGMVGSSLGSSNAEKDKNDDKDKDPDDPEGDDHGHGDQDIIKFVPVNIPFIDTSIIIPKIDFHFPLPEKFKGNITSKYAWRKDKKGRPNFHQGIDYGAPEGTPVEAAMDGEVLKIDYTKDYGNRIILKHKYGFTTEYSHLSKVNVIIRQVVKKGKPIGLTGKTPVPTATQHLHFVIRINNDTIDPLPYLE